MTRKRQTTEDNVLSSDDEKEYDKLRQNSFNRYAEGAGIDMTHAVQTDVGIFESYTLLLSALGALEFGFLYTTIFVQILIMVSFAELVKLQLVKDKEAKIVIKTKVLEWYIFFCTQLAFVPKYWLTLPLLRSSGMAPEPGSFISLVCYEYHVLVVFCLFMLGQIMFVISLQDGFYSYQFKMLGWTLISSLMLSAGSAGMLLALWRCRMWFFYSVVCISVHNALDYLTCRHFPLKTPMLMLKPDATLEGFAVGVLGCFLFFTVTTTYMLDIAWFMQLPTKLSMIPFDSTASVLAQGPLFEPTVQGIMWPTIFGFEPIFFVASEFQIHLFVITVFIAFVSPFGGFLFSGLKQALRQSSLGIAMFKGGVIDRLDCMIITGCFLLAYISLLVYKNPEGMDPTSYVLDMVASLSKEAQKELYFRLKEDIMSNI